MTQEHSLSVAHIVLLQPKTVPKTSSGKIARARCRKGFLDKNLQSVYAKSFQGKVSMEIESNGNNKLTNVPPRTKVDPESIRKLFLFVMLTIGSSSENYSQEIYTVI